MVKIAKKCSKRSKIIQNGLTWSKMVENNQQRSKMAGLTLSGPDIPA